MRKKWWDKDLRKDGDVVEMECLREIMELRVEKWKEKKKVKKKMREIEKNEDGENLISIEEKFKKGRNGGIGRKEWNKNRNNKRKKDKDLKIGENERKNWKGNWENDEMELRKDIKVVGKKEKEKKERNKDERRWIEKKIVKRKDIEKRIEKE